MKKVSEKSTGFLGIFSVTLIIFTILGSQSALSQTGRVVTETVYSDSIAKNLLGDDPNREVSVYLPAAYDQYPDSLFPVIYLLHGYLGTNASFLSLMKGQIDNFFLRPGVQPMIIVAPNAYNTYQGSWYTNSYVTGDWEDFIVLELVNFIDSNYRTIATVNSRGIAGHSMGGYGALTLGMKHPDIYGAVYGLSSALVAFDEVLLDTYVSYLVQALNATSFNNLYWRVQVMIAAGVAFAPDTSSSPFPCQFPITADTVLIDSIWQKWLVHDPYTMIDTLKSNLLQLTGLKFDCGTLDDLLNSNRIFAQKLTNESIPHSYVEYNGDHSNKIAERILDHMLPFFSDTLATVTTDLRRADRILQRNFSLEQNYPNPFNPTTTVAFYLPEKSEVSLKVFNLLGEEVSTLLSASLLSGSHSVDWDAGNLASGVYLYRLEADGFVQTRKMILMR